MDIRPVPDIFMQQEPAKGWRRVDWAILLAGLLTMIIAIGVGIAIYLGVAHGQETHARFMRQCMEDHKEYECTALWRAGDRAGPDLIMLPIPLAR